MRARVIAAFRDREHMERTYWEGDEFDGSAERVSDLASRGYVEPIAEEPAQEQEPGAEPEPKPKARKPRAKAKTDPEDE